jgi:hypothetical protein
MRGVLCRSMMVDHVKGQTFVDITPGHPSTSPEVVHSEAICNMYDLWQGRKYSHSFWCYKVINKSSLKISPKNRGTVPNFVHCFTQAKVFPIRAPSHH